MTSLNTKDPLASIAIYRHEALRAAGNRHDRLVLCWRLVMDAAHSFFQQDQDNEIFSFEACLFNENLASLRQANQEAKYRFHNSPTSSEVFTPRWIFAIDELEKPAACYRTWMFRAQTKSSNYFQREIFQAAEAVKKYQSTVPRAAFFAQEVVSSFERAQKIQRHSSAEPLLAKELTTYRWAVAATAAAHAATMHLRLQAIILRKNPILLDHWIKIVSFAEQAFYFRVKAAEATQQGKELDAAHWALAAYGANKSRDIHERLLKLFPSGNEEHIAFWTEALFFAEEATRTHKETALSFEKKRERCERAVFWQECCYDCSMKLLEASSNKDQRAVQQWREMISFTKNLLKRDQEETSQHFFSEQKISQDEKKIRKKLLELLMQEIFFFDPEKLIFKSDVVSEKIFSQLGYSVFYSWIYQTWNFFKEAHSTYKLTADPNEKGIVVLVGGFLESSCLKNKTPPADVFLIDIVADGKPNPLAHFHILQNKAHARLLPRSLFMPHWPQPDLIPRDSNRGDRFENVCFFGTLNNLAPELQSRVWQERLKQELGVIFHCLHQHEWSDYREVDCVIGIRDFSAAPHFHKPATKLYNAWLAGVPFIGGRDSAYAADGDPGKNYLVAHSLEELFEHLKRLKEDHAFRAMLVENGGRAGVAFTKEATLARWEKLFHETLPKLALAWHRKPAWQRYLFLQTQRFFCWLHHFLKWTSRMRKLPIKEHFLF